MQDSVYDDLVKRRGADKVEVLAAHIELVNGVGCKHPQFYVTGEGEFVLGWCRECRAAAFPDAVA